MSLSQQSTTNPMLDGFRRALDVLIAHAPGTSAEIKRELLDAINGYNQHGAVKSISRCESRLAGHLMMMSFAALHNAPIKDDRRYRPQNSGSLVSAVRGAWLDAETVRLAAGQPGTEECAERMPRMARRANRSQEERHLTFQERLAKLLPEPPALTMLGPSPESGPGPQEFARPFLSPSDQ